jgi:tetratricopeptide (TPR) repeat protein
MVGSRTSKQDHVKAARYNGVSENEREAGHQAHRRRPQNVEFDNAVQERLSQDTNRRQHANADALEQQKKTKAMFMAPFFSLVVLLFVAILWQICTSSSTVQFQASNPRVLNEALLAAEEIKKDDAKLHDALDAAKLLSSTNDKIINTTRSNAEVGAESKPVHEVERVASAELAREASQGCSAHELTRAESFRIPYHPGSLLLKEGDTLGAMVLCGRDMPDAPPENERDNAILQDDNALGALLCQAEAQISLYTQSLRLLGSNSNKESENEKRLEVAQDHLRRAMQIDPRNARVRSNLGLCLFLEATTTATAGSSTLDNTMQTQRSNDVLSMLMDAIQHFKSAIHILGSPISGNTSSKSSCHFPSEYVYHALSNRYNAALCYIHMDRYVSAIPLLQDALEILSPVHEQKRSLGRKEEERHTGKECHMRLQIGHALGACWWKLGRLDEAHSVLFSSLNQKGPCRCSGADRTRDVNHPVTTQCKLLQYMLNAVVEQIQRDETRGGSVLAVDSSGGNSGSGVGSVDIGENAEERGVDLFAGDFADLSISGKPRFGFETAMMLTMMQTQLEVKKILVQAETDRQHFFDSTSAISENEAQRADVLPTLLGMIFTHSANSQAALDQAREVHVHVHLTPNSRGHGSDLETLAVRGDEIPEQHLEKDGDIDVAVSVDELPPGDSGDGSIGMDPDLLNNLGADEEVKNKVSQEDEVEDLHKENFDSASSINLGVDEEVKNEASQEGEVEDLHKMFDSAQSGDGGDRDLLDKDKKRANDEADATEKEDPIAHLLQENSTNETLADSAIQNSTVPVVADTVSEDGSYIDLDHPRYTGSAVVDEKNTKFGVSSNTRDDVQDIITATYEGGIRHLESKDSLDGRRTLDIPQFVLPPLFKTNETHAQVSLT